MLDEFLADLDFVFWFILDNLREHGENGAFDFLVDVFNLFRIKHGDKALNDGLDNVARIMLIHPHIILLQNGPISHDQLLGDWAVNHECPK